MRILVIVLFLLSGCGVYKSQFDCPPGPSIGCEPVSFVNDLVNDNELDRHLAPHLDGGAKEQPESKDEEIKIWIREYTDKDGVHKAHNVYIKPGWNS